MAEQILNTTLSLEPPDNERLANLCGPFDTHLSQIERYLGVRISGRGGIFSLAGGAKGIKAATRLLRELYDSTEDVVLNSESIELQLQSSNVAVLVNDELDSDAEVSIRTKRGIVKGRGANQIKYLSNILNNDINFGIGPAGTGKTYLAVACAVEALQSERVQRLVLARPAVEAGERLGFLPGDLSQKIDPYLRPLYDALYEMLGFEKVTRLIDRHVIEIAPLAFMRGRTLNDSFIILDEAQNTTTEQMKMFLTRVGFGSTAVVTGDITQVDLAKNVRSGLIHASKVLKKVKGVSFTWLEAGDVVRHPLVKRIVMAYEAHESDGTGRD